MPLHRFAGLEWVGVVTASTVLVAILFGLTEPMPRPDLYDGKAYLRMAEYGFYGYTQLGVAAPFAYRPAVPWLAHLLSGSLGLSLPASFRALAFGFSVLNLCLVYGLARSVGASRGWAGWVLLVMALSHFVVRGPLYFYTLIDVETYALVLAASWALWKGRWFLALGISWCGLFFKEWLLIPGVLAGAEWGRAGLRSGSWRAWGGALLGIALTLALFGLPRFWVPVSQSFSSLDSIRDFSSLVVFVTTWERWANLLFCLASFWLPTLMLLSRERVRDLAEFLVSQRFWMGGYALGVLLLAFFGGTNIMIFVTYSLPLQVILLSGIVKKPLPVPEGVLVVVTVVLFNKIFVSLPPLDATIAGRDAWLDFYGGWGTRLNESTAWRTLWIALAIFLANGLRSLSHRRASAS